MKRTFGIGFIFALIALVSCSGGEKDDDRGEARELFARISALTRSYTKRIAAAPDSAAWASLTAAYEDSLAKINFSFRPDTDLEMSEGENDTLYTLTKAYIEARDSRIHDILHPKAATDTISQTDSLDVAVGSSQREAVSATSSAR